jgi:hypothetical protein
MRVAVGFQVALRLVLFIMASHLRVLIGVEFKICPATGTPVAKAALQRLHILLNAVQMLQQGFERLILGR